MRRDAPIKSFERLLRRADFVAAGKGARTNSDAFGLQTRRRADEHVGSAPRFGITVTKKTAPLAVDRNRMRRRLREALRLGAALSGLAGHDYVIVGRQPLLTMPFRDLQATLADGLRSVTQRGTRRRTVDTTRQGR